MALSGDLIVKIGVCGGTLVHVDIGPLGSTLVTRGAALSTDYMWFQLHQPNSRNATVLTRFYYHGKSRTLAYGALANHSNCESEVLFVDNLKIVVFHEINVKTMDDDENIAAISSYYDALTNTMYFKVFFEGYNPYGNECMSQAMLTHTCNPNKYKDENADYMMVIDSEDVDSRQFEFKHEIMAELESLLKTQDLQFVKFERYEKIFYVLYVNKKFSLTDVATCLNGYYRVYDYRAIKPDADDYYKQAVSPRRSRSGSSKKKSKSSKSKDSKTDSAKNTSVSNSTITKKSILDDDTPPTKSEPSTETSTTSSTSKSKSSRTKKRSQQTIWRPKIQKADDYSASKKKDADGIKGGRGGKKRYLVKQALIVDKQKQQGDNDAKHEKEKELNGNDDDSSSDSHEPDSADSDVEDPNYDKKPEYLAVYDINYSAIKLLYPAVASLAYTFFTRRADSAILTGALFGCSLMSLNLNIKVKTVERRMPNSMGDTRTDADRLADLKHNNAKTIGIQKVDEWRLRSPLFPSLLLLRTQSPVLRVDLETYYQTASQVTANITLSDKDLRPQLQNVARLGCATVNFDRTTTALNSTQPGLIMALYHKRKENLHKLAQWDPDFSQSPDQAQGQHSMATGMAKSIWQKLQEFTGTQGSRVSNDLTSLMNYVARRLALPAASASSIALLSFLTYMILRQLLPVLRSDLLTILHTVTLKSGPISKNLFKNSSTSIYNLFRSIRTSVSSIGLRM